MVLAVKTSTQLRHRRRVLPVLVHIEEHLGQELELDALAARAGFSPFHFHRVFSEVTGESPMAFIRRLRLERAVYRMKVSPENVLQIGLEAGFQSAESFTRAFVRHYRMKPSEFRAMLAEFRRCLKEFFGDYRDWDALEHGGLRLNVSGRQPGFRLEQFEGRQVIFKRYIGGYGQLRDQARDFASLWGPLFAYADAHSLDYDRTQLIGICHDDPYVTDAERIRFDACLPITGQTDGDEEIGVRHIAGGMCSVRQHFKGFEEIDSTFAFIGVEWVPARSYMLDLRPPFELYQCQHIDGELVRVATDAYVPLKSTSL